MKNETRLPSHLIQIIQTRSNLTSVLLSPSLLRAALSGMTILLLALTSHAAPAKILYPKPKDLYVNDFAKALPPESQTTIRTVLAKFRSDTTIEMVVVTIQSIHDYKTADQNIESFATNLFNSWGIGNRQRNDGVLILVAVKDRSVRIELGSGYGNRLNTRMQGVISQQMLPHFRNKNYSLGIVEGTNAVVKILSERPSTTDPPKIQNPAFTIYPTPPVRSAPILVTTGNDISSNSNSNPPLFLFLGIAGIAAVCAWIWYACYFRERCPQCNDLIVCLNNGSEQQYLDEGQQLEKSLGSVNYRVWHCQRCDYHTLQIERRWISSFSECQACGYRTKEVTESIITDPTYTAPGAKEITKRCHHCGFLHQETIILPMFPPPTHYGHSQSSSFDTSDSYGSSFSSFGVDTSSSSSDSSSSWSDSGSSSSDSFSGGSSSGDGSSGSW